LEDEFEEIKGSNKNPYVEEGQITQWPKRKGTKGQTTIYKTLHKKLKIEQRKAH
jgi:hypothetical protein